MKAHAVIVLPEVEEGDVKGGPDGWEETRLAMK